jgi:hypothetical protein
MDTQVELKALIEPEPEQKSETPSFAKQVISCCGSGVLILIAVYCTLGALISAFSVPAETGSLFWICMLCALAVTVVTSLYRGKGLLVLIFPVFLLFLLNLPDIFEGGKWVAHEISFNYSLWLPVSALFSETFDPATDPTAFLSAAGVVLSFLLGFAICLRRSLFLTITITAPIVFLTFVITNLNSDVIYLLGVISVYLTLLISGTVKPDSFMKRGLIIVPSFVIAMAFMILVYMFAPYGQYAREEQIAALGAGFRTIASQMGRLGRYWQTPGTVTWDTGWIGRIDTGLWQFNTSTVSIADAGIRTPTHQSLLEITSSRAGTFYMRGYSMQSFDGRSWYNRELIPDELDTTARRMPASIAYLHSIFSNDNSDPPGAQMTISRTGDITPRIIYEPYYNSDHLGLNVFPDNTLNGSEHSVEFIHINGSIHGFAERMKAEDFYYTDHTLFGESVRFPENSNIYPIDALRAYANVLNLLGIYTEIDSMTAQGLREIAIEAGIDPGADRAVISDAVSRYIRSVGGYTLSPAITPESEDFALYFLQELREGYCIHFATAAVLMLRALDVPARFTTGYVVTVSPDDIGQTIILTDINAHAWVEVFYEDIGWLFLEATPSGGTFNLPAPIPHEPAPVSDEQDVFEDIPEDTTGNVTDNTIADNQLNERETDHLDNGYVPGVGIDNNSGAGNKNAAQQDTDQSTIFEVPRIVIYIIFASLAVISIIIRRNIMYKIRDKRFKQIDSNKAVIQMWRYIKRLGRKEIVAPNDIEELALKARFSQHRITDEERAFMEAYKNRLVYEISHGKGDYGRLWLKYIRALC